MATPVLNDEPGQEGASPTVASPPATQDITGSAEDAESKKMAANATTADTGPSAEKPAPSAEKPGPSAEKPGPSAEKPGPSDEKPDAKAKEEPQPQVCAYFRSPNFR